MLKKKRKKQPSEKNELFYLDCNKQFYILLNYNEQWVVASKMWVITRRALLYYRRKFSSIISCRISMSTFNSRVLSFGLWWDEKSAIRVFYYFMKFTSRSFFGLCGTLKYQNGHFSMTSINFLQSSLDWCLHHYFFILV